MGLAELLDVCLRDIQSGAGTIEDCLARYPQHADELRPLLEMAVWLEGVKTPEPSPAFQAQLRQRLMDLPEPTPAPRQPLAFPVLAGRRRAVSRGAVRWLAAAAAVMLLVLSLSTAALASDALPDEPLYPVKRATEQVRLAVTFNAADRAQLHAMLAELRRREAEAMLARGQAGQAENLLQEARQQQDRAVALGLPAIPAAAPTVQPSPLIPTATRPAPPRRERAWPRPRGGAAQPAWREAGRGRRR